MNILNKLVHVKGIRIHGIQKKLVYIAVIFFIAFVVSFLKLYGTIEQFRIGSPMYEKLLKYHFILDDINNNKLDAPLIDLNKKFSQLVKENDPGKAEDQVNDLEDNRSSIGAMIAELKETGKIDQGDFAKAMNEMEQQWKEYSRAADDSVIPLVMKGNLTDAQNFESSQHTQMYSRLSESLSNAKALLAKRVNDLETSTKSKVTSDLLIDALICLVILTIALLVLLFISRSIVNPLRAVICIMRDITFGEGDLTKRLNIKRNDEIGTLSNLIDTFLDKLRSMVGEISNHTTKLSVSAVDLSGNASQLANLTDEMASRSMTVASSTEQATTNIKIMSKTTDDMSGSVGSVAKAIKEMSTSVDEVAKNCQVEFQIASSANDQAKTTLAIVDKLDQSAKEINKVIDVINNIADKTNLLALNATIQAVSAGDAGKGFAVVANEVKQLAKQTAQATREIHNQIEDMQNNTIGAVKAIENITKVIKEINNISQTIVAAVEEQSATINEIARNVGSASAGASGIAQNVGKSAKGLSEVSSNIVGVNKAAQDTAAGVGQIRESATDLATLATQLQGIVNQFKV